LGWAQSYRLQGVTHDHGLLSGGDNLNLYAAVGSAVPVAMAGVGSRGHLDAQPGEALTDHRPDLGGMLADTGRKDEAVQPAQRAGDRRRLARDPEFEQLDRLRASMLGLSSSTRMSPEMPETPSRLEC